MLQMLYGLQQRGLYVTGEETREQVATTAHRIGAMSNRIYVFTDLNLEKILAHARELHAQTIVIDPIQKLTCNDVNDQAGSMKQLRECTKILVHYAKTTNTGLWLISHLRRDGCIAGPQTIQYDVDVVLTLSRRTKFKNDAWILSCFYKNRFGPTNVSLPLALRP